MLRLIVFLFVLAALAAAAPADMLLNTNLLANSDFESGLDGWTTDGATLRAGNPVPHGGAAYLAGSVNGLATTATYQVIDLAAGGLADDSLTALFGGWQSGWETQRDSGLIALAALDADGAILAAADTGWFYSNHTWTLRQNELPLPAGTVALRYTFTAQRYEGYNNDGYLDDAFVSIVPEPATLALLALGAAAIVRRR
ncbi:MAG: PEP-CTERM sorting domain-containing protein [Planctomycetes bacterium]|nr:PEP-CTERM sorting domain-containing protein [Planctomycetota bacterium]